MKLFFIATFFITYFTSFVTPTCNPDYYDVEFAELIKKGKFFAKRVTYHFVQRNLKNGCDKTNVLIFQTQDFGR